MRFTVELAWRLISKVVPEFNKLQKPPGESREVFLSQFTAIGTLTAFENNWKFCKTALDRLVKSG